jgi:hypothetical protein
MADYQNTATADTIVGTVDRDYVSFYVQLHYALGSLDNDHISVGGGHDTVFFTAGTDSLFGGDGYDEFIVGSWLEVTDAPEAGSQGGYDRGTYYPSEVLIDIAAGTYSVTLVPRSDPVVGVPQLQFSGTLDGFERIITRDSDDTILGSSGGGFSAFLGANVENFAPGDGNDSIDGRGGYDILLYNNFNSGSSRTTGISVDYATGTLDDGSGSTDSFVNVERIVGSRLSDTFIGDERDQEMDGGGFGADSFFGGDGFDRVYFIWCEGSGIVADLLQEGGSYGNGDNCVLQGI